jgi:hypothetical protein
MDIGGKDVMSNMPQLDAQPTVKYYLTCLAWLFTRVILLLGA